jgi:hypothetical protein
VTVLRDRHLGGGEKQRRGYLQDEPATTPRFICRLGYLALIEATAGKGKGT